MEITCPYCFHGRIYCKDCPHRYNLYACVQHHSCPKCKECQGTGEVEVQTSKSEEKRLKFQK